LFRLDQIRMTTGRINNSAKKATMKLNYIPYVDRTFAI